MQPVPSDVDEMVVATLLYNTGMREEMLPRPARAAIA
jgi:hypothetical protein